MTEQAKLELVISGNPSGANQALKSLGQNMRQAQTQSAGMAGSVKDMAQTVGRTTQSASTSTASMGKTMRNIGSGIVSTLTAVGVAATATAAVLGAVGLGVKSLADSALRTTTQVEQLARVTGLSAENASKLRAGAQLLGVDFNTLQGSITAMLNNMKTLNTADNPFRLMGVQVVDGSGRMRDFNAILSDTLNRLQAMGPTGARTMFAERIFGGATPELLRMIDSGSEGLKKAAESAQALGLVITPSQIEQANQYRIAVAQMGQAWEGVKLSLGTQVMPILTRLMTGLVEGAKRILPQIRDAFKPFLSVLTQLWNVGSLVWQVLSRMWRAFTDNTGAGRGFANILKSIQQSLMWFSNGLKGVSEWLTHLKERIDNTDVATAFGEMWQNIKDNIHEGIGKTIAWLNDPQSARDTADAMSSWVENAFAKGARISDAITGAFRNLTNGFADFFGRGGQGPQLFDSLSQFIDNYAQSLNDPQNLQKFWNAGKSSGASWANGSMDMMESGSNLLAGISGLTDGVAKVLKAVWSNRAYWAEIAKTFLKGWINGATEEFAQRGPEVWDHILQRLKEAFPSSPRELWSGIGASLSDWITDQQEALSRAGAEIADWVSKGWTWAIDTWGDIAASLGNWIAGMPEQLKALGQQIADAVASAWRWAASAWDSIASSLSAWISSQWEALKSYGKRIGDAVGDAAKEAFRAALNSLHVPQGLQDLILGKDKDTSAGATTQNASGVDARASGSTGAPAQSAPSTTAPTTPSTTPTTSAPTTPTAPPNMRNRYNATPMADGGVFMPRPGGHIATVNPAEAGIPEAFLPLEPSLFRRLGLTGGAGVINLTVINTIDGREVSRSVKRIQMNDIKMQQQMAF